MCLMFGHSQNLITISGFSKIFIRSVKFGTFRKKVPKSCGSRLRLIYNAPVLLGVQQVDTSKLYKPFTKIHHQGWGPQARICSEIENLKMTQKSAHPTPHDESVHELGQPP